MDVADGELYNIVAQGQLRPIAKDLRMLIIRAEQMQAMADAQARRFRQRLAAHLGIAPAADGDVRRQLERCVAAAAGFGLHTEREIARFAQLAWRHRGGYPAAPLPRPALAILMSHGLDPARKLARFAAWVDADAAAENAHG